MGYYLHPNMIKNVNFRGLHRIWRFLPTLRRIMNLPLRQPRFFSSVASLAIRQGFIFRTHITFFCLKPLSYKIFPSNAVMALLKSLLVKAIKARTYFSGWSSLHLYEHLCHPPAYSVQWLGHLDLETQAVDYLLYKSPCLWYQQFLLHQHSLNIENIGQC